jgi:hypothetical protein
LSALNFPELYFLLDDTGSLVAYQESHATWSGVLAFSEQSAAERFRTGRKLQQCKIVAVELADAEAITGLIKQLKPRAVRCLFLDLNYDDGRYLQVEFEGDHLGDATERQFKHVPH